MSLPKQFKIKVTPEQSEVVQIELYRRGIYWFKETLIPQWTNNPYLYIHLWITRGSEEDNFLDHKYSELTFDQFCELTGINTKKQSVGLIDKLKEIACKVLRIKY